MDQDEPPGMFQLVPVGMRILGTRFSVVSIVPSKFRLRRIFKPLVLRVAGVLARAGMSPNQATWSMLALSLVAMVYFISMPAGFAASLGFGLLVFLVGIMDGVDGGIARLTGRQTPFGGILDSTLDRISDMIIFFSPAFREVTRHDFVQETWFRVDAIFILIPVWVWSILLGMGAFMISYVRARTAIVAPSIDMDVGPLGRSERLFIFVLGGVLHVLPAILVILAIGANCNAFYRVYKARAGLSGE